MGFIESFLGFASDGGALEAVIPLFVITVVTGLGMGYFQKHNPHN